VEFDLAQSYGPAWTMRDLLALGDEDTADVLDTKLTYSSGAGNEALRSAIGEFEGVKAEDVQIVTGAQEALLIVFLLAAERGRNVVLPQPGYPPCAALARGFGLEVRHYALKRDDGFRLDVDEVLRHVDERTAIVLINSPHNPTGSVVAEEDCRALHAFCAERGIALVCDQVYHPIYHAREAPTAASLPNTTVVGDLSKAFCLSGLRVGWIVERDAARMQRYRTARTYFTVSNGPLSERLALHALRHRDAILGPARALVARNLRLLDGFYPAHAGFLGCFPPGGGFVTFPWLRDERDARPFCQQLRTAGVFTVPGDCFGAPDHLRLGFGVPTEQFARALERMSDVMSNMNVR
jgi:aspartate/methionine/tyrosine aminotransferase